MMARWLLLMFLTTWKCVCVVPLGMGGMDGGVIEVKGVCVCGGVNGFGWGKGEVLLW